MPPCPVTRTSILHLRTGAAIEVEGALVASQGKGQKWEMVAKSVIVHGNADEDYPLQKKGHTAEFLRSIAHLRPRSNLFGCVFRVRSRLAYAVHQFFQDTRVLSMCTPRSSPPAIAREPGEMFRVTTLPASGEAAAKRRIFSASRPS